VKIHFFFDRPKREAKHECDAKEKSGYEANPKH
jgi:hypothetical protein